MKVYAYKVVMGELRFKSSEDEQKILSLMEAWRKAINDSQRRDWHMGVLPKLLQRTAGEFIEQQRKSREARRIKGEPVLHRWMVQLYPDYARFKNMDLRSVAITTLDPRQPIVAEFRCRRSRLLMEALNSPLRDGSERRHVLEVCNPRLIWDRDDKLYLIYTVRKLVEISTLDDLKSLDQFIFLSVDINTSDVAMGVFKHPEMRQLIFHRFSWNYGELEHAQKVINYSKSVHGNAEKTAKTWKAWLRRRRRSVAHEAVHNVMATALNYGAKAIVTERLSNNFRYKNSRKVNRRVSEWLRGTISKDLRNKAAWNGLPTLLVGSYRNSKTCRCGNTMTYKKPGNYHLMTCKRCGFTDDRDHIATHNIAWRFSERLTAPR